jgi:hypothetical protein
VDAPGDQFAGADADARPGDAGDAPGDPTAWDAAVSCGDKTCGAGQFCLHHRGDADAGPDGPPAETYDCVVAPASCAAVLSCECLPPGACAPSCVQENDRTLRCGLGA